MNTYVTGTTIKELREKRNMTQATLANSIGVSSKTITNVSEAAFHMNYSRRQIQRVLKVMTENGTLIRTGKGCYALRQI